MPQFLYTFGRRAKHHLCFLLFESLSIFAFWQPSKILWALSLHDETYSHILVVPLISFALLYLQRRALFSDVRISPIACTPFLLTGFIVYSASRNAFPNRDIRLSLIVCALVLVLMGGFVLSYGIRSFRAALFPLLFLSMMIPLPSSVIDKAIFALQKGSAIAAYALFRAFGVPVLWSGFKFTLPGVEIEVAKECSGIRSCLSLIMTVIVAGHIFLKSNWKKLLLGVLTVPIAIFKNAVRIVTLSCLGVYVDRNFLFGKLHRYGGLPFALIALALLGPVLWFLYRGEVRSENAGMNDAQARIKIANLPDEKPRLS